MTKNIPTGRTENHNSSVTPQNPRSRLRTRQRAPDLLRQHRLSLGRNPANQKTLTQIDFIQRTPRPEEFLDEADFQEIQSVERGGGDRLEGILTPPSMNESLKHKPNPKPKPRKRKSGHSVGRRRSGRGEEYHDRTLTQMVNVDMRHGMEDDNPSDRDRHLVSAEGEHSAQKRSACDEGLVAIKPEDTEEGEDENGIERFTPTKRARLDDGVKTEEGDEIDAGSIWSRPRDHANSRRPEDRQSQIFRKPQTPQKPRRYVVPSSQSPESPEITFGSPNKVKDGPVPFPLTFSLDKSKGRTGSPLKHDEVVESSVRLSESPPPGEDIEDSQFAAHDSLKVDDKVNEAGPIPPFPLSPTKLTGGSSESLKVDINATPPSNRPGRQPSEPTEQKPIVIYETDCDESETENFHDAVSQLQNNDHDSDRTLVPSSQPKNDDSLQYSDSSYPDHGSIGNDPECTMRSDASLLYSRRPLSYAYEKIHDTQNLGVDYTKLSGSPGATDDAPESDIPKLGPAEASSAINHPGLTTGTDKANLEEQKQQKWHPPSSPVVQIESSQRSDIEICASDASDSPSETRGVLTASQLLTESLMESIPVAPAWLFNEDHTQDELVDR